MMQSSQGRIDLARAELAFQEPLQFQGWNWVCIWLRTSHWQDGIGAVSGRSGSGSSVGVDPKSMAAARELLAWALSQVAHGPNQWRTLDGFLANLWSLTNQHTFGFYRLDYAWKPQLAEAQPTNLSPPGPERQRATWINSVGLWVANAILVTLYHLGLVEREPTIRPGLP